MWIRKKKKQNYLSRRLFDCIIENLKDTGEEL